MAKYSGRRRRVNEGGCQKRPRDESSEDEPSVGQQAVGSGEKEVAGRTRCEEAAADKEKTVAAATTDMPSQARTCTSSTSPYGTARCPTRTQDSRAGALEAAAAAMAARTARTAEAAAMTVGDTPTEAPDSRSLNPVLYSFFIVIHVKKYKNVLDLFGCK